jgi:DNA-directed RNA polymerase subunit M/transcription elongation factor TFIIS
VLLCWAGNPGGGTAGDTSTGLYARGPYRPVCQLRGERAFPAAFGRRYSIPTTIRRLPRIMDFFDPAGQEFLRLSERYRQMSDEELLLLIPQTSQLTPFAQEALATEVRHRGLAAEVQAIRAAAFEHASPKFRDSTEYDGSDADSSDDDSLDDDDSSYNEDRTLVGLCTVWSVRDALKVQRILDNAGIPFFLGPEKATGVDKVTSNFANGVSVQIMQIGLPWARQPMQHFEPEDDPTPKKEEEELEELPVRCPKCHSTEVVFEGRTSAPEDAAEESSEKYKWTCDSCGHQWEDDGIAKQE